MLFSGWPDLSVFIAKISAPAVLVPGDKFTLKMGISNISLDTAATGSLTASVYASTDQTWDAGDIPLGHADKSGTLKPTQSFTLSGTLPVPSTVMPGHYYLIVKLNSNLSVADQNPGNDVATSQDATAVEWSFGNVGIRKNVGLTLSDGNNPVKFSLSGPGKGQIANPTASFAEYNVTITNSTTSTNLTISTPAKTFTTINNIDVHGPINKISAGLTNLETGIDVTGLAKTIVVHDIQSVVHNISINTSAGVVPTSAKLDITANVINGCTIDTGGIPLGTLKAYKASDLAITAPTVANITMTNKITIESSYTGVLTIQQGGATVPANAKVNITAGVMSNCTLNTNDLPIGSLTVYQATNLDLTAPYIQSMKVTDNTIGDVALSGSVVLDVDYGKDNGLSLGTMAIAGDVGGFSLGLDGGSSSISARSWEGGRLHSSGTIATLSIRESLTADVSGIWINKATVGGDYSGTWRGNFGSLTVSEDIDDSLFDLGPHTGIDSGNQFNALTVGGWISNSTINAFNPVGTITVGGLRNSNLLIGATAVPASQGDFEALHNGTIKSLTVKGVKIGSDFDLSVVNSNIVAWQITTLKLALIDSDNSGTPFGVTSTSIGTFTYRHQSGITNTSKNLTTADSFTDGDFALHIL